LYYALEVGRMV